MVCALLALSCLSGNASAQMTGPTLSALGASADALAELRARVRAGETEAALAQLDALARSSVEAPVFAYLRARLYERQQQLRAALSALPADVSGFPEEVARDMAKRRALWQASEGDCELAAPFARTLDSADGALSLRIAECALARNQPATALNVLRELHGGARKSFEARFALSQALEQSGDKAAAINELRELYVAFPEHKSSSEVSALLQRLLGKFEPTQAERFDRVQRWLDVAQPEAALEEISHIAIKPAKTATDRQAQRADRGRLLHMKGMALFRMRTRYAEAAKVLNQAAAQGGATATEDAFHAIQALARADKDREAVKAYYKFAKQYPKDHLAHSAIQNAVWLELRHDLPGGEAHMQAFLKRAEKVGKRALADPLWQLATYTFKHQRYKESLPLFERYAATGDGPMVKARGLYWAGRCADLSSQSQLALRYYRDAMNVEPLHWYSLMARGRIVAAGEDPGPPLPERVTVRGPLPSHIEPVPLPAAAAFYSQLGLDDDAVGVLRAQESNLRRRGDNGLVPLLAAYHTLGEYQRPYQLAVRERHDTLLQPPDAEQRAVWTALYPRPYVTDVAAAAEREQIAAAIVFAVMRKESGFKPNVVSYADAIGLLQMLLNTGRTLASEIGITHLERSMLLEPATNIQIGTHYLGKLIAHYRGGVVPAIAAYNAGEHKVDEWLRRATKKKKSVELDWFVEDIPFEQTRNYVRGVVTSWARYVYLEQPEAAWPLDLPPTLSP